MSDFKVKKICGDRNCLVRSIAVSQNKELFECKRNEGGYPTNPNKGAIEDNESMKYRRKAVVMIKNSEALLRSHAEEIGEDYLWRAMDVKVLLQG